MNIPFTSQQFLEVFKNYNLSVWPIQIFFYLLAVIAVYSAVKRVPGSGKIIYSILSILWIWMGIVYHFIFFTEINKAAYLFAVVFMIQGVVFFHYGVVQDKLTFELRADRYGITGGILISFALIIYPALGYYFGHIYPYSPTFGLPCPTTIFTFGILLWSEKRCPPQVLIIPLLWSIVGFFAAFSLGIYEDTLLLISGLASTIILILKKS